MIVAAALIAALGLIAVTLIVAHTVETVTKRLAAQSTAVVALSDRWRGDFAELVVASGEQFRRQVADLTATHKTERDVLLRAVMSRSPSEFASLERSGASAQRTMAESARPVMTSDEYAAWVKDDLARLGVDDEQVAPILEGL